MGYQIYAVVLGAVASVIGSLIVFVVQRVATRLKPRGVSQQQTYQERLQKLTDALAQSSREADAVLGELTSVVAERAEAATKLESELEQLANRERELQKRISELQNVPIAVAEHFAALTKAGEKRSARRDYGLFAAGVLVSTIVSVLIFLLQSHK